MYCHIGILVHDIKKLENREKDVTPSEPSNTNNTDLAFLCWCWREKRYHRKICTCSEKCLNRLRFTVVRHSMLRASTRFVAHHWTAKNKLTFLRLVSSLLWYLLWQFRSRFFSCNIVKPIFEQKTKFREEKSQVWVAYFIFLRLKHIYK